MHQVKHQTFIATLLAATLLLSLVKAAEHVVNIQNFAFNPPSITIAVGDTVRWINRDSVAHTSTSDTAGLWESGSLTQGKNYTRAFNVEATYQYHCKPHPNMKGTVIVKAQGGGGGGSPKPSGAPSGSPSGSPTDGSPAPGPTTTDTPRSDALASSANLPVVALFVVIALIQQLAF
ncbi:hypothetical protein BGW42_006185 [Actinomortierella wolfii]|nr:hypothetical protein BGW42_006185 [Actinomortierella wolfii]